jgi:hypothetical protein
MKLKVSWRPPQFVRETGQIDRFVRETGQIGGRRSAHPDGNGG